LTFEVREYLRADGTSPYGRWFAGLTSPAAAKVAVASVRLAMGNLSRVKWIGGIGEYVVDWGPGYRIYLAREGAARIILLGGGTKRRQQVDIERARSLFDEYRARRATTKQRPAR
jgi:putative addiction module killer protein